MEEDQPDFELSSEHNSDKDEPASATEETTGLLRLARGPTWHVMSGCRWSLPAAWDVIEGSRAISEEF